MDGVAALRSGKEIAASALTRRRCATTRPPLARPSSSSARPGAIATFFISSSARFSAADWCSTARCSRPHRQRRRARIDADRADEHRRDAAPQLIACASHLSTRAAARGGGTSIPRRSGATPDSWGEFGSQLDNWIEEVGVGSRLCVRRGDLRHRRRGDRHRRRDAGGGAPSV